MNIKLVPNPMLRAAARNLTCPCASMMKVKDCTACGLRIKRNVKPETAAKLEEFIKGALKMSRVDLEKNMKRDMKKHNAAKFSESMKI